MGNNQSAIDASDPNHPGQGNPIPPPSCPEDFTFLKVLGKGTFATVYLAKRTLTGQIFAIKVLSKQQIIELNEIEHTIAERSILAELNHPFLMRLYAAFQTYENLYLVLEYIPGGELFFHLRKRGSFPEQIVRLYAAQLLLAIEYLHKKSIIIRDLKPENILLQRNGYLKITDFGLSKNNLQGTLGASTFAGTSEYLSPEQLKNQGHGKGVDYWCLGTIIYELVAGIPPFFDKDKRVMYRNIIHKQVKFPSYFSEHLKDLVTGLLIKDPRKRLGCRKEYGEADEVRKHPFFKALDFDKLYRMAYPIEYKPEVKGEMDLSNFDNCFTILTLSDVKKDILGATAEPKQFKREHGNEDLNDEVFRGFQVATGRDGTSTAPPYEEDEEEVESRPAVLSFVVPGAAAGGAAAAAAAGKASGGAAAPPRDTGAEMLDKGLAADELGDEPPLPPDVPEGGEPSDA